MNQNRARAAGILLLGSAVAGGVLVLARMPRRRRAKEAEAKEAPQVATAAAVMRKAGAGDDQIAAVATEVSKLRAGEGGWFARQGRALMDRLEKAYEDLSVMSAARATAASRVAAVEDAQRTARGAWSTTLSEALAAATQTTPLPIGMARPLFRLRGSKEIHVQQCPLVAKAIEGGVLSARDRDGPPCSICRPEEARARRSL